MVDGESAVKALQTMGQLLDEQWPELAPEVQAAIRSLLGLV
jgi:hypothetical protein